MTIPFQTHTPNVYVFPVKTDMYNYYDRTGEGVFYRCDLILAESFFHDSGPKLWHPAEVQLIPRGFDSIDYLTSYGISLKKWESHLWSCWIDDPVETMGLLFWEELSDTQTDYLKTNRHAKACGSTDEFTTLTRMFRAAKKQRLY